MTEVEGIIARVRADFEKSLRDEAKARDSLAKASADVARFRATLEVLGGYAAAPAKLHVRESGVAREGSKAKKIVDIAISYIERSGPTFGPVLMESVQFNGIELGNNPKQQFASAMSRDPRVSFGRETGWQLAASSEEIEAEANPESETSASNVHSNQGSEHKATLALTQ